MKIEQTVWGRRFKKENKFHFEQAMKYAYTKNLKVKLIHTNELSIDEYIWAIVVYDSDEFWMEAGKDKQKMIDL